MSSALHAWGRVLASRRDREDDTAWDPATRARNPNWAHTASDIMENKYSDITGRDNTRMHIGANYDNSQTTNTNNTYYNNTQYHNVSKRARRWSSQSEEDEERRQNNNREFLQAVSDRQKRRADFLFDRHVVSFHDERKWTSLHCAAETGYLVDHLIEKGFDVNAQSTWNGTPICIAAVKGNADAVHQLVAENAKLNISGIHTPPPLHSACRLGNVDIVKELKKRGADIKVRGTLATVGRGQPLLQIAEPDCYVEASPLGFAMYSTSLETVTYLLDNGADLNTTTRIKLSGGQLFDEPLLCMAVRYSTPQIVGELLKRGVDKHARDNNGLTVLHHVAFAKPEFAEGLTMLLLADVARLADVADVARFFALESGIMAPLHVAAQEGQVGMARSLLKWGTNVDDPGVVFRTPLHVACIGGHLEVARLLLEYGANLAVRGSPHNSTPLDFAVEHGHLKIVKLLLRKEAESSGKAPGGRTPLHLAADFGHSGAVKFLLKKGARTSAKDDGGRTPLHLAARSGCLYAVALLLENEARHYTTDKDGCTALHLAADSRHSDIVEFLLTKKACMSATDDGGRTPLHLAARSGSWWTVKQLLEKGADSTAKDKAGLTPYDCAKEQEHHDLVGYIDEYRLKASQLQEEGDRS